MRHHALAFAALFGAVSLAVAADDRPVMVYPAPKAKAAPVLDGKLNDACWKTPPVVSAFTLYDQPKKLAHVQTRFRVTYDDEALYVAVACNEPEMAKLKKSGPGIRDEHSAVFQEECIELFLDPFHEHANHYQVAIAIHETIYDGLRSDAAWDSNTRVVTRLGSKAWFMELALPWADVGVKRVEPGMVMGFNLCRDRLVQEQEWTNWSPVTGGFHNARLFGHLVLSPTAKMLGALSDELRKGGRHGELRVFSSGGSAGVAYLEMGRTALAKLDRVLAELDALCTKEPPAVAKNLRKRIAAIRARVKPFRDKLAARKAIDSAEWSRIGRVLAEERQKALKSPAQVRLKTLLDEF